MSIANTSAISTNCNGFRDCKSVRKWFRVGRRIWF